MVEYPPTSQFPNPSPLPPTQPLPSTPPPATLPPSLSDPSPLQPDSPGDDSASGPQLYFAPKPDQPFETAKGYSPTFTQKLKGLIFPLNQTKILVLLLIISLIGLIVLLFSQSII